MGIIEGINRAAITSVRAVTEELNRQGIKAPRGGAWHPTALVRLLNRLPNRLTGDDSQRVLLPR